MERTVNGRLNKQTAAELGISEITVKVHRGKVMRKMQADTLPDLKLKERTPDGPADDRSPAMAATPPSTVRRFRSGWKVKRLSLGSSYAFSRAIR